MYTRKCKRLLANYRDSFASISPAEGNFRIFREPDVKVALRENRNDISSSTANAAETAVVVNDTPSRGRSASIPARINNFISANYPNAVCNRCIAAGIGIPNQPTRPAQITGALGTTSDFIQDSGHCAICGCRKTVIRRHP